MLVLGLGLGLGGLGLGLGLGLLLLALLTSLLGLPKLESTVTITSSISSCLLYTSPSPRDS